MTMMRTRFALPILSLCLALACGDGDPVPTSIGVSIVPSRVWYQTGQRVELRGGVLDQTGMPISAVEVVWTVEPEGAASQGSVLPDPRNATFTLSTEGTTTFTGCVVPTDAELEPWLCDSLSIRVDDGMPVIELETPQPGAELDDPEGIVVRGSVSDRSMVRVYANGQPAEVDGLGQFAITLPASFGVNHLVVSASDGFTDASTIEMDVLWAHGFTPALAEDGTPSLTLDDGMRIWLGQPFFDDGVPLDLEASPVTTHDLADVLELVIASLDIQSVIPDPVIDEGPSFTMRVTDARLSEASAELDLTDDGAELFLRIGRVDMNTSGALMIEETSLPLTGSITGSAVAFAHITIRKESEDGELEVVLDDLAVGLESIEGTFASDETSAVFRLVEGIFRTTVEELLVTSVRGTLEDSVPAVLRDALTAIDTALADQEIPLDSAPFPPVTITIDGRIRELRTTFRGEMEATLRTTVGTLSPSVHPESRGVPRIDLLPAGPRFYRDGSMKLGVRLAMLNGLLHALWSSGLLTIDATPILPEGITGLVSEAQLNGRIAPVLRPPTPIETDDLILTLGQLELDLLFMGEPVRYAVSLEAGVNVELTSNHIGIGLSETPVIHVWTLVPPEDERLINAEVVRDLLLSLWPDLRESIAGGLAFDLPIPSLGDLGGLAPELAGLTLQLDMTDQAYTRRGTLMLDAAMTGVLPATP